MGEGVLGLSAVSRHHVVYIAMHAVLIHQISILNNVNKILKNKRERQDSYLNQCYQNINISQEQNIFYLHQCSFACNKIKKGCRSVCNPIRKSYSHIRQVDN